MIVRRSAAKLILTCFTAVFVAGCATKQSSLEAAPAPNVRMGNTIELLRVETARDKVRLVAEPDGNVHAIISTTKLNQVFDVLVGPEGVIEKRLIRSNVSPWQVDGALDSDGQLNVLIDNLHLVYRDREWREVSTIPALNEGNRYPRFVPGAPRLTWLFQIDGSKVEAPHRMEVFFLGGGPAAIIFPWFTTGSRAVVARNLKNNQQTMVVVEPTGNEDTAPEYAFSDPYGNVHLIYSRSRAGMLGYSLLHYVKINNDLLEGVSLNSSAKTEEKSESKRIVAVAGEPIGQDMLVIGETANGPVKVPKPACLFGKCLFSGAIDGYYALTVGKPHDPWFGNDFPVEFRSLLGQGVYREWSGPLEVGLANSGSSLGFIWDALGIVTSGKNRSFLVWPTTQGLYGRWVEH
jgi:hypothetical protein